jgi:hypothetical protein
LRAVAVSGSRRAKNHLDTPRGYTRHRLQTAGTVASLKPEPRVRKVLHRSRLDTPRGYTCCWIIEVEIAGRGAGFPSKLARALRAEGQIGVFSLTSAAAIAPAWLVRRGGRDARRHRSSR